MEYSGGPTGEAPKITTGDQRLGKRSRRLLRALRIPGETGTIDRVVYATITVMSVLIIYDGWEDLTSSTSPR